MKNSIIVLGYLLIISLGCASNNTTTPLGLGEDIKIGDTTLLQNPSSLAGIVTPENKLIPIVTSSETFSKMAKTDSPLPTLTLTLVAEVSSPTINGILLQATSVNIQMPYAFISYNAQGDTYAGALDVINISKPDTPTIESRVLYSDRDTNAVYYGQTQVLLAQAMAGLNGNNALFTVYSIQNGIPDIQNGFSVPLEGSAATSVYANSKNYFVTTGSIGNLYVFDLPMSASTLSSLQKIPISDARWVSGTGNNIAVLSGGSLETYSALKIPVSHLGTFSLGNNSLESEAKSVVKTTGNYFFIAANKSGVLISNLTGSIVHTIPIPTGLSAETKVSSNSVTFDNDLMFISNGEAGVYVAQNSKNLNSATKDSDINLTMLGNLSFETAISVNHVEYQSNMLFIAAGTGGVKIVSVSNESNPKK